MDFHLNDEQKRHSGKARNFPMRTCSGAPSVTGFRTGKSALRGI